MSVYLQEEIRAEGLIRRLPPFTRFLRVAALSSGQLLNYAQVASDAEVAPSTVREYFSVLEDTLVGWTLEPWRASRKRKAIQTAKFYLFDPGVMHELAGTTALDRNSDLYGRSSSTSSAWSCAPTRATPAPASPVLLALEARVRGGLPRRRADRGRGEGIAEGTLRDARGLLALKEENAAKRFFLVSEDPIAARREGIEFLPWTTFFARLWSR